MALKKIITDNIHSLMASHAYQEQIVEQNKRYRSFMFAVPYEFIGWSNKDVLVVSPFFNAHISQEPIKDFKELLNLFSYEDKIDVEQGYKILQRDGLEFKSRATITKTQKTYEITGTRGQIDKRGEEFNILWFKDVTDEAQERDDLYERLLHAKQSEVLYQTTFESFPFPVWIRNQDNQISWCNRAYARVFDSTPAGVIDGQLEMLPTSQAHGLAEKVSKLDRAHSVYHHVVMNGERRYVEITEIPIQSASQNLGFLRDVTDIEVLQKELKNYNDANSEVLGQLAIPVAIFDREMRLDFYNAAYQLLWEVPEKWLDTKPTLIEILNKKRENRLLPEQADFRKYVEHWRSLFNSLIEPHEEMMFLPNGKALRMVMVPHPGGGAMVTFEDVTSRLELERSYNTLIAVQQETINNLAEAVSVFGADGRLKLYNLAYKKIWGLPDANLDNNPHISELVDMVPHFFDPEQWPEIRDKLIASCLNREAKSGRFERVDGSILDYTLVPLPDGALLCSYVDVTDTVNVEQALREKNAALEEADKLKSGFLANVSYQLRTPLNALLGFADLLDKEYFGDLNEKQHEYTGNMLQAGHKLVSLIDDILDLSTIQAGYLELHIEKFNVSDVLEKVKTELMPEAEAAGVTFDIKYPREIGTIEADYRRLTQVLNNLVLNAFNFTKKDGEVMLMGQLTESKILFTVVDTGIGMTEEQLDKVFQPFVRMQKSRDQRGAGIGLALVKSITELHGGTIEIESKVGEGTAVTVSFPRRQGA